MNQCCISSLFLCVSLYKQVQITGTGCENKFANDIQEPGELSGIGSTGIDSRDWSQVLQGAGRRAGAGEYTGKYLHYRECVTRLFASGFFHESSFPSLWKSRGTAPLAKTIIELEFKKICNAKMLRVKEQKGRAPNEEGKNKIIFFLFRQF